MNTMHLNPRGLSAPPGGIYSHVVKAGGIIFISGQLARDAEGNVVGAGDAASQYRQVLSNVKTALSAAGATLSNVVKTTTYVVGEGNLAAIRAAREQSLETPAPASTMVVVAALANPDFLVEVDAVAVLDTA